MSAKHLLGLGIGFNPGSVKYMLTLGLGIAEINAGTGQTGTATIIGYGRQAAGLVTYARQSGSISGNARKSVTLESP